MLACFSVGIFIYLFVLLSVEFMLEFPSYPFFSEHVDLIIWRVISKQEVFFKYYFFKHV